MRYDDNFVGMFNDLFDKGCLIHVESSESIDEIEEVCGFVDLWLEVQAISSPISEE